MTMTTQLVRIGGMLLVGCFLIPVLAEARYYDPKTGRFLQRDPESPGQVRVRNSRAVVNKPTPQGVDPLIWNTYLYVANNPINFTDPFGLFPKGTKEWDRTYGQCQGFIKPKFEQAVQQGKCPTSIKGKSPEGSVEAFCEEFAVSATEKEAGWKGAGFLNKNNTKKVIDDMKQQHPDWPWAEWESQLGVGGTP